MTKERVIREQLYLLPSHDRLLKKDADCVSEREFMKRPQVCLQNIPPTEKITDSCLDAAIWEEERKYIMERWAEAKDTKDRRGRPIKDPIFWERDELYDE
ncbi:MAG: hypothetical protein GX316_00460 [Firmicutes bacterium]|nr:hypothetical protein [Bacillota bacterium]